MVVKSKKSPDRKKEKVYSKPEDFSRDFYEWPQSWMGFKEDLPCGESILKEFVPFIHKMIAAGLAKGTIKKYMDHLWTLGGEIITEVNNNDSKKERQLSGKQLIKKYIDEYGGPTPHGLSRNNFTECRFIEAYNYTCRRFFKFLNEAS
jgi:hypothetical protein